MCMRRKKPTASDSQYDAIAQNMGAVDASTKFLTINSAYGSNDSATNQDLIDINGSTKVDETPLYEDMEEVRKTNQEKKNESELNEDKALEAQVTFVQPLNLRKPDSSLQSSYFYTSCSLVKARLLGFIIRMECHIGLQTAKFIDFCIFNISSNNE